MVNRFKYYFRFFFKTLREEGIRSTLCRLGNFLLRRSLGIELLVEWFDYEVLSHFRSPTKTIHSIFHPVNLSEKSLLWALYSSFDRDSSISEHVLTQLSVLSKKGFSILFISSSPQMDPETIRKLSCFCRVIIHRKNIGHDFGSWRTGYELIKESINRNAPVILMNDSCFGPYGSMDSLFSLLTEQPNSVVGVSKSYLIEEHLQSYFLGFGSETVRRGHFDSYMSRIRLLATKEAVVRFFEIGGSHHLKKLKIPLNALIDPLREPVAHMLKTSKSDNAIKDPVGSELVEKGLSPLYKRSNGVPLDLPLFQS